MTAFTVTRSPHAQFKTDWRHARRKNTLARVHDLRLIALSLRYSSWSMRPWIVLTHAGANFVTEVVELPGLQRQGEEADSGAGLAYIPATELSERRALGSVTGLFPVLRIGDTAIHESLAICELVAETFPAAGLWPADGLARARARSLCCEMVSGFMSLRGELSCHLFGRVPEFAPSAPTRKEIVRVFEIWSGCLDRSGGPFLFGEFGITDAMYYPVLTRLRTYCVPLAEAVESYARALGNLAAVKQLEKLALSHPRIPIYDEYLTRLGGDPIAGQPAG